MPIPKEVLSVNRPKNTVVIAYGKNKDLYAVRQRVGCRNDNGRHLPVNGPTIGHIVDLNYVPLDSTVPVDVSIAPIDLKDWCLAYNGFTENRKQNSRKSEKEFRENGKGHVEANKPIMYPLPERQLR